MAEAFDFRGARGAVYDSGLSCATKAVLVQIIEHQPQCRPSVPRLAGLTSLSERQVTREIARLEQSGIIAVIRRPGRPCVYRLPEDWKAQLTPKKQCRHCQSVTTDTESPPTWCHPRQGDTTDTESPDPRQGVTTPPTGRHHTPDRVSPKAGKKQKDKLLLKQPARKTATGKEKRKTAPGKKKRKEEPKASYSGGNLPGGFQLGDADADQNPAADEPAAAVEDSQEKSQAKGVQWSAIVRIHGVLCVALDLPSMPLSESERDAQAIAGLLSAGYTAEHFDWAVRGIPEDRLLKKKKAEGWAVSVAFVCQPEVFKQLAQSGEKLIKRARVEAKKKLQRSEAASRESESRLSPEETQKACAKAKLAAETGNPNPESRSAPLHVMPHEASQPTSLSETGAVARLAPHVLVELKAGAA